MKIAIISDIHGNLEALKKTIKDIENRKVDKIICLGDIMARGMHPKECLDIVREKCEIVLCGNCDSNFVQKDNMSEKDKEYISKLPFCYEFYISGSLVRLFHATPTAINRTISDTDTIEKKYQMFLPSKKTESQNIANIVIYGHIHHSYMNKIYDKTLINVGSVGNSYEFKNEVERVLETKSNYLIIEGDYGSKNCNSNISFQFVKIPYDLKKRVS